MPYSEEEMSHQLWIGFWFGVGTTLGILAILLGIGLATGV